MIICNHATTVSRDAEARRSGARTGFTLVEIIVVITILSILFAMTAGAVMKAMDTANQAKISQEITQISAALESFKAKYGMYPPSQFLLMNKVADYNVADPFQRYCKQVITTMFPRIDPNVNIGWTGGSPRVQLNGCESLVFFLGGRCIVSGNNVASLGFTANPSNPWPNPAASSVNLQKGETFYSFEPARLQPSRWQAAATSICVYKDGYASDQPTDMPFFYFSSHKSGNDYGMFAANGFPDVVISWPGLPVAFRIAPFMNSQFMNPTSPQNRFFNPNGFQLISAGKNKRIGNFPQPPQTLNGVVHKLSTAPHRTGFVIWENGLFDITSIPPAERTIPLPPLDRENETVDNLCNFHDGKMGTPN